MFWGSLMDYVTVGKDKTMVFTLIGGTEIADETLRPKFSKTYDLIYELLPSISVQVISNSERSNST